MYSNLLYYLDYIIKTAARCTCENKSRTAMAKIVFNRKKTSPSNWT
jgi:hypothetical protein